MRNIEIIKQQNMQSVALVVKYERLTNEYVIVQLILEPILSH